MAIVYVGSGSYTTELPQGETGVTSFQGDLISPLVSDNYNDAVPSSDWASSLHFAEFGDPHSSIMYAHPLAMKAQAEGLSIGYTPQPIFIEYQGTVVKYEYTYHSDLNIGLTNLNADSTTLADQSDWTVTAQWQDSDSNNSLEATYGHGMPFVYFSRNGNEDVSIELTQSEASTIGQPNQTVETFTLDNVTANYLGGDLGFNLAANGVGAEVAGNAAQARISIDSDGDGKYDYIETFNFIPLDANPTDTENYTDTEGRGTGAKQSGELTDIQNGSIKVEVWQTFGAGQVELALGEESFVDLPFDSSTKVYLDRDQGENQLTTTTPSSQTITLGDNPDQATLPWDGDGSIWYHQDNVVGLTINGSHYGLFAPEASSWQLDNGEINSDLAGADYFSVAVLPDDSIETLNYFHQHAYAFIDDTTITYDYDQANSVVNTTFTVTTDLKEQGFSDEALVSLYRHQYINSDDELTSYSYESPRGEMKLAQTNEFTTTHDYHGILPAIPNFLNPSQTTELYTLVDDYYQEISDRPITIPGLDTYWVGKEMAKFAEVAQLSDQLGHTEARDYFIGAIKAELEDWFTVDSTEEGDKQFYYNAQWDTFQGYPASFHSETQINDHHFHYGYFVKAAATIAQYDPSWAEDWGGMVNLLIKDVANTDRADTNYPYLRNFDPYAGHSWASGHGAFAAGNNEESSSESMNFASSTILWGAHTGNQDLVELGTYLYATENEAINQYWFDIDDEVFPQEFDHSTTGMVWGDGAAYATWFSGEPEMIHGINFLPMSGASLYLGQNAQYVAANYTEIIENNGADPNQWMDIIMQYQAFYDPEGALAQFNQLGNYNPEEGETHAHTYHWLNNFNELGEVETSISANNPFYAVFNNQGELTYTAYNPSSATITVEFSDGTSIELAPQEFIATNSTTTWSSITGAVRDEDPDIPVDDPPADDPPADDPPADDPPADDPPADDPPADDPPADDPPADDPPADDPPADDPPADDPPADDPPADSTIINGTNNSEALHGTMLADTIDALDGNDHLHGNDGDDTLLGGNGDDHLHGNNGNDNLQAGVGSDYLHGNDGHDELYGNQGKDYLYGNSGDDKLSGGEGGDYLVGGDGADHYVYSSLTDSTASDSDIIETFSQGDKIDLSGLGISSNHVNTELANGYLQVSITGTDFLIRVGGVAEMNNDDFIFSATGEDPDTPPPDDPPEEPQDPPQDPEPPEEPEDPPPPDNPTDNEINGTANNEGIHGTHESDTINGLAGDDQLHGLNGDDQLNGGDGNDQLHGNDGNDYLNGGNQSDHLHGNLGDDVLLGDAGLDFLYGNEGDDTLHGGSGRDFLVGGSGKDTYAYTSFSDSTASETDTIEGFVSGEDILDLSDLGLTIENIAIVDAFGKITVSANQDDFKVELIASTGLNADDILF